MFKKLRILPILIMALVAAIIAFSPAGTTEAGNKIADGIFLGDQDLSGKTMTEAAAAMEAYYEKIAASDLTINVRKLPDDVVKKLEAGEAVDTSSYAVIRSVKVPISTFDFEYSIEEALRVASSLGQTGKLVERYKTLMDMKYGSAQLPLSYSVDGEKVKEYVEKVFAPENTKDPVDAKFSWGKDGLQVRSKEQDGYKVYNNLTINAILQAFDAGISEDMSCTAAVGTVSATVTSDSLSNIKFSKVATYTTRFYRGSDEASANRSHNIDMACKYVNGTMVQSGQRVSLNQLIGMRTVERGFKTAAAFFNGKVVQDLGGGICQFATTVYQCLLQTEMTINVRYNHSLAVTYVSYSQDATLDWGYCDLIFTNNWNNPIYIECGTTTNTVTVSIYGVDERPKNRTVEYKTVVDEEIKTLYPAIVLEEDKAPAKPTREGSVLSAVKSHLEKIVRVNGVIQSTTKINNDYYKPLRANVHVGCKGLKLTVKRVNDIDQIYDQNGNQLLLNTSYEPIFNGRGGYYLAKDYQHDANGVALGGKLTPVSSGSTTPTQPSTEPTTQPTQPPTQPSSSETQPTQPPTQPSSSETQPTTPPTTACTHPNLTNHSYTNNNNGTHKHTATCTQCNATVTVSENETCTRFSKHGDPVPATCTSVGYTIYKCDDCGYQKWGDETAALGHNYGAWTSDGQGHHSRSCSRGDDTQTGNCSDHYDENGNCTVCGYHNPNYQPPTQATETDPNPGEGGGENGGN